jgi:hypothetical protein
MAEALCPPLGSVAALCAAVHLPPDEPADSRAVLFGRDSHCG